MPTDLVDGAEFQKMWRDRPVLVITGEVDHRIPMTYVEQRVANLRDGKVTVSARFYPEEDHFLFFSQPDNVLGDISHWLSYVEDGIVK
jgi:pimeloyl-ACP methyl ester carboxylesterase